MHNTLTYKHELYRKGVHLSSSIFPFMLYLLGKQFFLIYILPFMVICIFLDYAKSSFQIINNIYFYFFRIVTRSSEYKKPTGATWVFTGIILTVLLFKENIAITSLIILSISDSMAAIIGLKFGKTKLFSKTLEGSFAFYLSTFLIISITTNLPLSYAILISIVTTFSELVKLKINDNVIIPLTAGLLLMIVGA